MNLYNSPVFCDQHANLQLTIHCSEANELADKHQDEQHPAASPEEQPVVPHRFAHQPTAMETLCGAPTWTHRQLTVDCTGRASC